MTAAPKLYSRRAALAGAGSLVASTATPASAQPLSPGGQFVELRPRLQPPPTRIERFDGKFIELAALRGKVVVVAFWATWCPPCRRELAQLGTLQKSIGSLPLAILAVSIDAGGRAAVDAFLKPFDVNGLLPYLDPKGRLARRVEEDAATPFVLYGMPISYLIDRQGLVAGYVMGAPDWVSADSANLLRRFMAD